jgi:hypothetical protein
MVKTKLGQELDGQKWTSSFRHTLIYIWVHNKMNVSRKVKTTSNLEQRYTPLSPSHAMLLSICLFINICQSGEKFWRNFWDPLSRFIRSIEHRLITKVLHEWTENHEFNPLSLINLSLEAGYCSTKLSNHDIIRLVRFISRIEVGVMECVLSLIHI